MHQRAKSIITLEDMSHALQEFVEKLGQESYEKLSMLAAYRPVNRLSVNLIETLEQLEDHTCRDVLKDCLPPDAYKVLSEVDSSGLSVRSREIAHGLFNVHERWLLMRSFNKVYKQFRAERNN